MICRAVRAAGEREQRLECRCAEPPVRGMFLAPPFLPHMQHEFIGRRKEMRQKARQKSSDSERQECCSAEAGGMSKSELHDMFYDAVRVR